MSSTGQDGYKKMDIIKDILMTIVMIVVFFAYWTGMLFLLSIFLVNVWNTNLTKLLILSGALTLVSAIVYIVRLVRRRHREIQINNYLRE